MNYGPDHFLQSSELELTYIKQRWAYSNAQYLLEELFLLSMIEKKVRIIIIVDMMHVLDFYIMGSLNQIESDRDRVIWMFATKNTCTANLRKTFTRTMNKDTTSTCTDALDICPEAQKNLTRSYYWGHRSADPVRYWMSDFS